MLVSFARLALVIALAGASLAQGQLLSLNGTELWVHRKGEGRGPAIVVVHGGPMLDHGYLLEWLSPLADQHEVVFYDQRLNGRSAGEVPAESVRVATWVEDIEALRRELGFDRIHLLGHSWGAHPALRYALSHPDRLRSLILLDPMAPSSEQWQQEQAAQAAAMTPEALEEIQRLRVAPGIASGEAEAIGALLQATFRTQFVDPARAAELDLYVPEDYLARSRQLGAMMGELSDFDLRTQLPALEAPTLLLYGDAEPGVEIGGRALHEGLPDARLVVIEQAGHFPFIEKPERFLSAVRAFLDGLSGR